MKRVVFLFPILLFVTVLAQDINKACPFKPADIVFVLDGSGSEGVTNFRKQLAFISNFSNQFEIGPNHTRIGLVTFATAAHNEFYLTDNLLKPQVMDRINKTHYPNGETNTHLALDLVRLQQFSHRYDNRNVTRLVIVLTDGLSLEPAWLTLAASRLKAMPMMTVMAIGIGSHVDAHELSIIATDSNHTFQVATFDQLQTIKNELTQTTCSICNADHTDIIFVLDGSGSEGTYNFHKQLDFVNLVINEFTIGPSATQVGVVQFYTGARTEIHLNSYHDATALMHAVQQIAYKDGETYTHMGLGVAGHMYREWKLGARYNANKAVIVLTDGRSTEPDETLRAANRLHRAGIETYAIGIGSQVDLRELWGIASDKQHAFQVRDFSQLNSIHESVVKAICAKNKFTTKTSTTTTTTTTRPTTTTRKTTTRKTTTTTTTRPTTTTRKTTTRKTTTTTTTRPTTTTRKTTTRKTTTTTTPTTVTTTPTTPTTTTKPECGQKPADIVFVLDSSDSEGAENFQKELDFVYRFAVQFKIGPKNVQFSLLAFSTDVKNQFHFNTYHSRYQILNAIRNTSYIGSGTNTSKALNFVRTESLKASNGARANATKIVVVITDGRSDSPDLTKAEAQLLHHNAEVFSIGVGPKVDVQELKDIASNARHVVQVNSFELLHTIEKKITDTACAN